MEIAGQPTYNECAGGADTDRDSDLVPARPQGKSKTAPLHETEAPGCGTRGGYSRHPARLDFWA
jgi:hypothetical protein